MSELLKAMNDPELMDCYLEIRDGKEIIADIKALISEPAKLTLLDQFAIAILTGFSSMPDERVYTSPDKSPEAIKEWERSLAKHDAEYCYEMARAMVAEKSKQP